MGRTKPSFKRLALKLLQVQNDRMFGGTTNANILRCGKNCFTTKSLRPTEICPESLTEVGRVQYTIFLTVYLVGELVMKYLSCLT